MTANWRRLNRTVASFRWCTDAAPIVAPERRTTCATGKFNEKENDIGKQRRFFARSLLMFCGGSRLYGYLRVATSGVDSERECTSREKMVLNQTC